jgi:hypothetical protein
MDKGIVDKYWIKDGMPVRHKGFPEHKMFVVSIKKELKDIPDDTPIPDEGRMINRTFVVLVTCHWLTVTGEYQKAKFHTTELEKWNNGQVPSAQ